MFLYSVVEKLSYHKVGALTAGLALLCTVVGAIYQLYFHPLAKFPGPFWAKLSILPSWYHTVRRDRHIWLQLLQERYGPEFRYCPNGVIMNTPEAYRTIYGPKGNVKKGSTYRVWPRNVATINTWNCIDVDVHARKRRVLNQAFSDRALRSSEPFIHSNTDRWLELLGQNCGENGWTGSLNMADWVNYLIMDILGDLCFGKCFNMKEPASELRHVPDLILAFVSMMHIIAWSPFSGLWAWLKPLGLDGALVKHAPSGLKAWQRFVDQCLVERTHVEQALEQNPKPESERRKDFFYWLFRAIDPETGKLGYNKDELWGECELLTIAGSDTTATVTSAMFFYLVRYPEVQAKLAGEIISAYSSLDEIKGDAKLYDCTYLTAVINETLRMAGPISADPEREVLPGGMIVNGKYLPEGVNVGTGLYGLSHNKDVYPQPFIFQPKRWIVSSNEKEGSSAEDVALAESGACSFTTGSRGCVGKNLAWLEMRLVMAKLIWTFEIKEDVTNKVGGGSPTQREGRRIENEYQTHEVFVSQRYGPMVNLKKRVH